MRIWYAFMKLYLVLINLQHIGTVKRHNVYKGNFAINTVNLVARFPFLTLILVDNSIHLISDYGMAKCHRWATLWASLASTDHGTSPMLRDQAPLFYPTTSQKDPLGR